MSICVRSSFSRVKSGRFRNSLVIHSSCTLADHFARNSPVKARCISKFAQL
jgi:hypothetical protein